MKSMSARRKYLLLSYAVLFCGFVAIVLMLVLRQSHDGALPVGMVRKTEIRMAPEVGGYLREVRFKRGDSLRAGEVLATLFNPEIDAAVLRARTAVGQAEAARARVYAGVRYEDVESARKEVEKAKSNLTLAQSQYDRAKQLIGTGDVSQQVFDDRVAQLAQARSAVAAAEAAYARASNGATDEDKAKADRGVDLAKAALAAAEARQAKLTLRAPVDARVWSVLAEPGEAINPGQPVVTLENGQSVWFSFNIREDRLNGLTIGSVLNLQTGDGKKAKAVVTELHNLGDFAKWRAESAISSYDLATFAVRADHIGEPAETLQPGMTAWIDKVE